MKENAMISNFNYLIICIFFHFFVQVQNLSLPHKDDSIRADNDIRLSTSLEPLHYLVKLQPFVNGNRSILGYTEITFNCLQPTDNITLHILDIITQNNTITLSNSQGTEISFLSHTYDANKQFYIGNLAETLIVGEQYTLSMNFEAYLNNLLAGFYLSQYKDENGETRNLGTTQMQPTDARRAFPCFDEPGFKSNFTIHMARESTMSSISNMPLENTVSIADQPDWFWDIYQESVPMSTYLVAFVVSDFLSVNNSDTNPKVLFRVWARGSAIDQTAYALENGPKVLTFLEDYFQVPYPLPKQDMIALPDFAAGAMENWGLITYRETALLYDPVVSSATNKQRVAQVISHELAHMWFGDLVTMFWWSDLWLNEGFASYVEYLGIEEIDPDMKSLQQFLAREIHSVFKIDCLGSSHPISVEVENPDQISELFDSISYSKGASIIRMMNHFLTESTFRQGITNYLNKYAYDNAQQDDLWAELTNQAHLDETLPATYDVKSIMDTWTLQMGFPVISVSINDLGEAIVSQERFLLGNSSDAHDYKWWIPLNYATQDSPNFNATAPIFWMRDEDASVTLSGMPSKDKWVIFNVMETAYYRVNYDNQNWDVITAQLTSDLTVIDPLNRVQIVDDSLNLARADYLHYNKSLAIAEYLVNERDFVVWESSMDNLEYIEQMFTRQSDYESLKSFLLYLVTPNYEEIGFADSLSHPHLTQLNRALSLDWSCHLGNADCINNAVQLYDQWMLNPTDQTIISSNQRMSVYCTAIAEGDNTHWDFAYQQFVNTNFANEVDNLLYSMGCSKDTIVLERYLNLTFNTTNSDIRKQDAYKVFNGISRNDIGRNIAWNYLKTNWDAMAEYYGYHSELAEFANEASMEFNTEPELAELQQLRDMHVNDLANATQEFDQAIDRTKINIQWMNDYYNTIVLWLNDNGYNQN